MFLREKLGYIFYAVTGLVRVGDDSSHMSWYIDEQQPIYLDYNATTPLDPSVKAAITEGLELWANPSSVYLIAQKVKVAIENARQSLEKLLHISSSNVVFTSGGTEANNWVIQSAVEQFKSNPKHSAAIPHVISSVIEHPSILEPLRYLSSKGFIDLSLLPVNTTTGQVEPDDIRRLLTPLTCLVTVMLANNETGVLQPIAELSDAVRRASSEHGSSSVFIHSDVCQAVGKIDVNINDLKVDAISLAGHKFYGPRNGALVTRSKYTTQLTPMLRGGGQQGNLRSGTENTPMIMGLGAAADACDLRKTEEHLRSVRDYFEKQLEASPVLLACGIQRQTAERTIRFSFGRETTKEDVDRVVKELKAILFLAKHGSSLMNVINAGPVPGF
uniref:Selenocysteine lyase n=1 Tax=Angiostrongylus cantonensis TaxID=6313 RepID=A0A0K0CXS9_ANGCA